MSRLSLKNVTKKCPNNDVVVKNFSLDIEDGEFVVLAGLTGGGKTLVIRMIAGLEESNSGEICIDGEVINDKEIKDRGVAMIFQNYTLYPGLDVYDNIAFALKLAHIAPDEIDRTVKEAAKFLGIEELLDKTPGELSEEETLQAVICRAIAKGPKVLLMDDTLARLTGEKKKFIEGKMVELSRRMNIPFVYATQGQEEAMAMATKIVIMKEGEIQQAGSPRELYERPANTFVALFLGQPHMNMVQAAAQWENGRMCLKFGENEVLLPEDKSAVLKEGGYDGKHVFMGIRPEDMEIAGSKKEEEKVCIRQAVADKYEEINGKTYLHAIIDETNWEVSAENHNMESGDMVDLAFVTEKVHIFCAETGEAVC